MIQKMTLALGSATVSVPYTEYLRIYAFKIWNPSTKTPKNSQEKPSYSRHLAVSPRFFFSSVYIIYDISWDPAVEIGVHPGK
jgi:hypothetical protein